MGNLTSFYECVLVLMIYRVIYPIDGWYKNFFHLFFHKKCLLPASQSAHDKFSSCEDKFNLVGLLPIIDVQWAMRSLNS